MLNFREIYCVTFVSAKLYELFFSLTKSVTSEKSRFIANSASSDSKPKSANRFWVSVDFNTSLVLERQLKEPSAWATIAGMVQTSLKAIIALGRRISNFVLVYSEGLLAKQNFLAYLIDILPLDISSSQITSLTRCS